MFPSEKFNCLAKILEFHYWTMPDICKACPHERKSHVKFIRETKFDWTIECSPLKTLQYTSINTFVAIIARSQLVSELIRFHQLKHGAHKSIYSRQKIVCGKLKISNTMLIKLLVVHVYSFHIIYLLVSIWFCLSRCTLITLINSEHKQTLSNEMIICVNVDCMNKKAVALAKHFSTWFDWKSQLNNLLRWIWWCHNGTNDHIVVWEKNGNNY